MKSKISLSVVAAAVALMALGEPSLAFSQSGKMPMQEHRGDHGKLMDSGRADHVDRMGDMMDMCVEHAEKVGISEAQITRMKPLHREMQKKQVRYRADLKIAEIELMEIMEIKDFDLEKAGAADRKMADIRTAYHLEMLKAMHEVRAQLTEEQFKKMRKMMMPIKMAHEKPAPHKMNKKP
jgi:Spy/CpxP family protein refolding chaperone